MPFITIAESYLNKKRNGVEPSDDNSVVDIPGQDVQSSCAALHYFLHAHTLLNEEKSEIKYSKRPNVANF